MSWLPTIAITLAVLTVGSLLAETLAERRDRAANPPPGRMVDVGGRRLHLLCKGDAPGPTVVIEQGVGSPSILWWPIQDQISTGARVCTYDRAGYQWSDPAPATYSLQNRIDDLHALLHRAGVPGPYVLVGHSFGGPMIRLYTATYPADVAGLVIVDGAPESSLFRDSYDSYAGKITFMARAIAIGAHFGLARLAVSLMLKPSDTLPLEAYRPLKSFLSAPGFYRTTASDPPALADVPPAMRRDGGFGDTLGDRPVIVLTHGEPFPGPAAVLEPGWADSQSRIAAQSSRGELQVATGCNHMIPFEKPSLVVDAIRRVRDRVLAQDSLIGLP
jgi:pimeloyl-ACP methyl ester carboxylesterase